MSWTLVILVILPILAFALGVFVGVVVKSATVITVRRNWGPW